MKRTLIAAFVCTLLLTGCGSAPAEPAPAPITEVQTEAQTTTEAPTTAAPTTETPTEPTTVSYTDLQQLFLSITTETTVEDVENAISSGGFASSKSKQSDEIVYRIAREEKVALQRYGDTGECIDIAFDPQTGALMYAAHDEGESFLTALLYNYGTYWDFRFDPGNAYSGYYYYKSGDKKSGVTLKYDNGNEKKTNYIRSGDAAEALRHPAYR